jgi:hypothetical protein
MNDMVFCVLFVGNEDLIRHVVCTSARRLGADWTQESIVGASLVRLRVMFFMLMDRDSSLKEKILEGWSDYCIPGIEPNKASVFFNNLRDDVINPWLIDERKTEDEFVSTCIDLYLVS